MRRACIPIFAALCIVLLWPLDSRAETSAPGFDDANKLYEQGKFAEAASAYETLDSKGPPSAAVRFNLGNAFFKSGQIGRAIAAYRHAEQLNPRDPDIRANLQFARKQTQGPSFTPDRWQRWLARLTLNEWALLACVSLWILLLLLAAMQLRPSLGRSFRGFAAVLAVMTALVCIGMGLAVSQYRSLRTVVVFGPDATVHNGPFDESPAAFRLNDGAELRVLDEKDNWLQVTADGRRSGWLKRDKVLKIS